jgi:hypothetical protein
MDDAQRIAGTLTCELCARGYAVIVSDFEELQPTLADPGWWRAHYAELHGHPFDAPERATHCGQCHDVGVRVLACEERRKP